MRLDKQDFGAHWDRALLLVDIGEHRKVSLLSGDPAGLRCAAYEPASCLLPCVGLLSSALHAGMYQGCRMGLCHTRRLIGWVQCKLGEVHQHSLCICAGWCC